MGLDIYVMPLHKYFSGDYRSPLEEAFGAKTLRIGNSKGGLTLEEAMESVHELQEAIMGELSLDSIWDDQGETTGEQFDYAAFGALRAFAAHQDHPKTTGWFWRKPLEFNPVESAQDHVGLDKIWRGARTRFPHLIHHSDNNGFWSPVDFDCPRALDPEISLFAGSSVRLRAELEELRSLLGLTRSWGDLEKGEAIADESDPLGSVKYACALMVHYARLSCERRLPIVFDG